MKPRTRKLLSRLFIFASIAAVVLIAFGSTELENAWDALFMLDAGWLVLALFCFLGCLMFDGLCAFFYLRRQHYPVSFWRAMYISTIGYYYANITPGASGGEPMQVYYMSKSHVPVGVATSCVILKMVFNQLMLIVVGTVLWLMNMDFVSAQLGGAKWAIIIGWIVNFGLVPIVGLVTINRPLVERLGAFLIRMGAKLHIIKNTESANTHMVTTLDSYHESILRLGRHPWHIVLQLVLSALSVASLLMVVVCVYHAFGSAFDMPAVPWYELLTASYLLFISASYVPLPGASGAQEGGFLVFFRGIFPSGAIGLALLVWRFFSFYLFLIAGVGCLIVENIVTARRKPKPSPEEGDTLDVKEENPS